MKFPQTETQAQRFWFLALQMVQLCTHVCVRLVDVTLSIVTFPLSAVIPERHVLNYRIRKATAAERRWTTSPPANGDRGAQGAYNQMEDRVKHRL
jgi:hypothetical protein